MDNKNSERKAKELIKKYEYPKKKTLKGSDNREMYLKQTDRNYKDGDRN